jgi:uncharacterized membrane protein
MTSLARPSPLGGYAQAVETSPVATLTTTGVMVGVLWGGLLGWLGSLATKGNATPWLAVGAAAGAVIAGSEGYRQGVELQQWLAQYRSA